MENGFKSFPIHTINPRNTHELSMENSTAVFKDVISSSSLR